MTPNQRTGDSSMSLCANSVMIFTVHHPPSFPVGRRADCCARDECLLGNALPCRNCSTGSGMPSHRRPRPGRTRGAPRCWRPPGRGPSARTIVLRAFTRPLSSSRFPMPGFEGSGDRTESKRGLVVLRSGGAGPTRCPLGCGCIGGTRWRRRTGIACRRISGPGIGPWRLREPRGGSRRSGTPGSGDEPVRGFGGRDDGVGLVVVESAPHRRAQFRRSEIRLGGVLGGAMSDFDLRLGACAGCTVPLPWKRLRGAHVMVVGLGRGLVVRLKPCPKWNGGVDPGGSG